MILLRYNNMNIKPNFFRRAYVLLSLSYNRKRGQAADISFQHRHAQLSAPLFQIREYRSQLRRSPVYNTDACMFNSFLKPDRACINRYLAFSLFNSFFKGKTVEMSCGEASAGALIVDKCAYNNTGK